MNKKLNRRSFLRQAGTGAGIGALSVIIGSNVAQAQITDRDSGSNADPGGQGRGGRRSSRTGLTDSDRGSSADRAGYGRGNPASQGGTGCSDSDGGSNADPANSAPCPDYRS